MTDEQMLQWMRAHLTPAERAYFDSVRGIYYDLQTVCREIPAPEELDVLITYAHDERRRLDAIIERAEELMKNQPTEEER